LIVKSELNCEPEVAETLKLTQKKEGAKKIMLYAIVAGVILLAAISFAVWRASAKAQVPRFKTEEVSVGDLTVTVTATGTLQPMNKVDVGSELSGTVKTVEVDYNSRVEVGQVMARLDTAKLEVQVTQLKAALSSAEAKALLAEATVRETKAKINQYQKVRELSGNRVPSQTEFDAAEAAYDRARADTASAKAAIEQAQANLDATLTDLKKSIIRSPIKGIVLARSVDPGQTVAASFQAPILFSLAQDLAQMELHVNVDEADIGKVQEGQTATFSVAAYPNRPFDAKITQARYGSSTTSGVVTYETVLKVDNKDLALRPGMTATASIVVKKVSGALLVPASALRFALPSADGTNVPSQGLVGMLLPRPPLQEKPTAAGTNNHVSKVYVLQNSQAVVVPVTTGFSDGTRVQIVSGLSAGQSVVVDVAGRSSQ
jgi:HlyD family secretion protein